jgi:hypothetical protein
MDEKRCETCRHWGDKSDGNARFRTCLRIQHDDRGESRLQERSEYVPDAESIFDEPAVTVDGSDYFAALRTKADFCCSLWEVK